MKTVKITDIVVGDRLRPLDEEAVERLVVSIRRHGLLQPITIRYDGDKVPHLVAGRHRMEAVWRLNRNEIAAIEFAGGSPRMAEVAENLHRHELTKEERDEQIRLYAELLEEHERIDGPWPIKSGRGRRRGPAGRIANATGVSPDTVRRVLGKKKPSRAPTPAELLARGWKNSSRTTREQFLMWLPQKAIEWAAEQRLGQEQSSRAPTTLNPNERVLS